MCTVCITILYAVSLYKTQGDFAQQCHMTLDLFPAAAKRVGWCLCFIWLFLSLCLPSLKSRCWDMLSGSGCKERMEPARVWGGGLVVSLPTDQITAGISSSVSIRSKEVNPLGSIWEKSVTTLMDMHHLHLNVRFLPFNSIKWRRAVWPWVSMHMRGSSKKWFAWCCRSDYFSWKGATSNTKARKLLCS